MKIVTFAEDNPQATTWFTLIHQGIALASPGQRPLDVKLLECQVLDKLDAISEPNSAPAPNGYQPRRLSEPCTVSFTDDELALMTTYLAGAGFQPYLSRTVRDLIAALATAPLAPGA